ncbi:MAG TPA: hypothetical protein QGF35_06240 [Dehalococcoidia bacterium]|nr:hypothetical protein [Dehalococcoidia bacterium]
MSNRTEIGLLAYERYPPPERVCPGALVQKFNEHAAMHRRSIGEKDVFWSGRTVEPARTRAGKLLCKVAERPAEDIRALPTSGSTRVVKAIVEDNPSVR